MKEGQLFANFVPEDSLDTFKANMKKCLEGERLDYKRELRISPTAQGWFRVIMTPAYDRNGDVFAVSFSSTNITDEYNRSKALIESESRYADVMDAINSGVWESDLVTGKSSASPYFYSMLGYSDTELPIINNEFISKYVHPEDQPLCARVLEEALSHKNKYAIEYRIKTKSDGYHWFSMSGKTHRSKDGKPVKIIGSMTDINDRKVAENKLREREQLINSINANISEGLYRSEGNGTLEYANKAFYELMGYDEYEVQSGKVKAVDFYVDSTTRTELLKKVQKEGKIRNFEVLFKRKDGTTFWALLSTIMVVSTDGNVFYDGAIRDITELKRASLELSVAKEQAEEMTRLKSNFLANMSHEIRTPINGILGVSELMSIAESLDEAKEYASIISESGYRLLNTINSILNLSRLESEQGDFKARNVDLNSHLKNVLPMYKVLADKKSISFNSELHGEELHVLSEESMLDQVLNNLIGNAIKFTEQGSVTVRTSLVKKLVKRIW